ncbi:hypothetical protein BGZ60DRAFT_504986 [Tricladium varicosporioides]|nr:hypothetical protein BGZ60DRAFT_504986 [Hymenoscyphus varicosporioides]
MVDPLSLAGLTLAICDELLKLGERTAELVHDIRAFDEDSTELYDKINDEGNRTSILRRLLFESATIYKGKTLFEQFEEDVQEQIRILLQQLKAILFEGFDLLNRRYGTTGSTGSSKHHNRTSSAGASSLLSTSTSNSSFTLVGSTLSGSSSPQIIHRKSSPSTILLLRWSFRDKKRVETIVESFRDMNGRIHEKVKLWCLASQLGVDLQHLQHLQNDTNSKLLGFDVDATLRLTAWDAESLPGTLEMQPSAWQKILKYEEKLNERFSTSKLTGSTFLVERFAYDIDSLPSSQASLLSGNEMIDGRSRTRIDALAKLLHQPKELVFRIPRCVGWKYNPPERTIAFIFDLEKPLSCKPVDLLALLGDSSIKISLGDKFRLALGLARCISQLHMVHWVHESFRSENILLFPTQSQKPDWQEPWVLGFESSRPDSFFSAGRADFSPARDVYRHPDRQGRPEAVFTKIHDFYALGVVLLEIGLWEPALTLEKNSFANVKNPKAVRDQLKKHAESRLASRVGEKYKNIVVRCLTGQFDVSNDTKEDLKLQQAFRSQVVDVLEAAAEHV